MSILHKHQRQTYAVIDNEALRDETLSFRARGLLAYLLSLPDEWRVNIADLTRRTTEGRDAVRVALVELEAAGYVVRERRQDDRGRWSTHTHVGESADLLVELKGLPTSGNPTSGEPSVGEPGALGKTQRDHPEEVPRSSELARSEKQIALDEIKNALVAIFGEPTGKGWALYNRIAVMVRDRGQAPADVAERAALMARDWGSEKVTPTSLEKHWARYDEGKVGRLSKADVEAWSRQQEGQARSDRRLREIEERDAYHSEMQRVRGDRE